MSKIQQKILIIHGGLIILLFLAQFILPAYHHGILARIMVLACYAMGYNIAFGYTGMLSLGHSLLFGAGLYGLGLGITQLGLSAGYALMLGIGAGALVSLGLGLLALRTSGVSFMIVTLMFAQVGFLIVFYFNEYTRGDEGFSIKQPLRQIFGIDLTNAENRYYCAFILFSVIFGLCYAVVKSRLGRVLIAIRENENRTIMLGYNVVNYKLIALVISGTMASAAGAFYGILFGYVGASFVAIPYAIYPLLWVLVGGAGTLLGPFFGTILMFYLIDYSSHFVSAYMLIVGAVLVFIIIKAPQGIFGYIRKVYYPWLP